MSGRGAAFLLSLFLLGSCGAPPAVREIPAGNARAQRFSISDRAGWTALTIHRPWKKSEKDLVFAVVDREVDLPGNLPRGVPVIRAPIRRAALSSTPQIAFFDALGALDAVGSMAGTRYVFSEEGRRRIAEGRIVETGGEGGRFQQERIFAARPDLLLVDVIDESGFLEMDRYRRAGMAVLPFAEYLESHPLGRAEWVRVVGLLVGKRKEAEAFYGRVERSYLETAARSSAGRRPVVLLDLPWNGTWYVSGSEGWTARLLFDAGGVSLFADVKGSGGAALSVEEVMARAPSADLWLHPGDRVSRDQVAQADRRFRMIPAMAPGRIWQNDLRKSPGGGLDYHEGAVVRPDLLLSELSSIIRGTHSATDARWYRSLP